MMRLMLNDPFSTPDGKKRFSVLSEIGKRTEETMRMVGAEPQDE
jgi:hypothetical protein